MCNPIGGGGAIPPAAAQDASKAMQVGQSTQVAGAQSDTTASPSGDAAAGAKALGGGGERGLAGVLQKLSAALEQLKAAVASLSGGGPIKGGGGWPDHAGAKDPVTLLAASIDASLARPNLTPAQRSALEKLRTTELAALRADAARTGSFNPVQLARVSLEAQVAVAPSPQQAALVALRPQLAAIEQSANRTGSFDPVALLKHGTAVAQAMKPDLGASTNARVNRLLAQLDGEGASGSFNPARLQRVSLEVSVAQGNVPSSKLPEANAIIQQMRAMESSATFDPVQLQQVSLRVSELTTPMGA